MSLINHPDFSLWFTSGLFAIIGFFIVRYINTQSDVNINLADEIKESGRSFADEISKIHNRIDTLAQDFYVLKGNHDSNRSDEN